MSSSDRPAPAPAEPAAPAPPVPTALRRDGTAPRPLKDRLLMLLILTGLSLAVAVPVVLLNTFFARHPKAAPPPPASVQPTPEPAAGLRTSLELSAEKLMPAPAPLSAEPIIVKVRPDRLAARQEKVTRQAAQFGGTAADGLATGNERHLYVDLPAAAAGAFRQAVLSNEPLDAAATPAVSPAPIAAASPAGAREHLEVFIRPVGEDE